LKKTGSTKNISLSSVLNRNEIIKETVKQAASELTSVNEVLKQGKKFNIPVQTTQGAITQNVGVEHKVTKAADDLKQVNAKLTKEVANRASFESELAYT
jgi:hypothetical protein